MSKNKFYHIFPFVYLIDVKNYHRHSWFVINIDMRHDLTIDQFYGILSDQLTIMPNRCMAAVDVVSQLQIDNKFSCLTDNNTHLFRPYKDFKVFFPKSETYLSFNSDKIYKYLDLCQLVNYAMQGQMEMVFVKSLSI